MKKPLFIMMVGLPGSGKSTYAEELKNNYSGDIDIISSDALRSEILGDENNQEENEIIFKELHKRIKERLLNGKDCIYDACNINYKRRIAFLKEIKKYNPKTKCIFVWTSYENCLSRNNKRNRKVPEYIIKRMYKNIFIPHYYEGWDEIDIIQNSSPFSYSLGYLFWGALDTEGLIDIPHDNHHHQFTIGEHILSTYVHAIEETDDKNIRLAALFHDIGKPFVKEYKDSKGNETDEAHYYQHHLVSAYMAVPFLVLSRYVSNINDMIEILALITFHMYPYFWEKENNKKMKDKYKRLWGEKLFDKILLLHKADDLAH